MYDDDDNEWDDDLEDISYLLDRYRQLKDGEYSAYLFSQEDFEILTDYLSDDGRYREARDVIDRALDIYPNTIELLIKKVDLLMDCNRDKEALRVIKYAKSIDPRSMDLVSLEVEVLCTLDKEGEAKNLLQKMLEKEEDTFFKIFLLQELISVHSLLEEYDQSYLRLLEVLKIDETNEEALHRMTFIINKTQRQTEFISYLEEMREKYPLNELIWYNLALAHQKNKDYRQAEIAYDTVLGLDPRNDSAYLGLTECYMLQKKYSRTIKHIEEYYKNSAPDYFLHQILSQCYEKTGQYHKARKIYNMMAVHFEYVLEDQIAIAISESYIAEKNWESAISTLLPILQHNQQNEKIYHLLGQSFAHLEEWESSIYHLEKAIDINEKNVTYIEDLIEVLLLSDRIYEAIDVINFAIDIPLQSAKLNYLTVAAEVLNGSLLEAEQSLIDALEFSFDYVEILSEYVPTFTQSSRYLDIISQYK